MLTTKKEQVLALFNSRSQDLRDSSPDVLKDGKCQRAKAMVMVCLGARFGDIGCVSKGGEWRGARNVLRSIDFSIRASFRLEECRMPAVALSIFRAQCFYNPFLICQKGRLTALLAHLPQGPYMSRRG